MLEAILTQLDDDKALDILTIDLKGKTTLGDYMVIASGRSHRQVSAIADHTAKVIKNAGFGTPQIEGLPRADWVLIDTGDIIVHVFRPEVRAFYNLEKMWSPELMPDALSERETGS